MTRLLLVAACAALFATAGCNAEQRPTRGEVPSPEAREPTIPERVVPDGEAGPDPEDVVSGVGTVRYVDLEGGFYTIVTDADSTYLPLNMEAAYEEDGLRVRFRAEIDRETMTAQQRGVPVQILEIMRLEE